MKRENNHKFNLFCTGLNIKASEDGDTLTISGFANTTTKDRMGDVILEEAWSKGGLDNYLKNPIVLAFHDPSKPIGEVTNYGINNQGLHVVAEISKAAGNVFDLIKENVLKAFSVGFMVKDADYDQETDIFVIKDLELYEISVVSIPANADSIFSVAKSFDNKDEYLKFKQLYNNEEEEPTEVIKEEVVETPVINKEKKIVEDDKLSLTPEELKAENEKAIATRLAEMAAEKARKDEITKTATAAGESGAERLIKELETRIVEKEQGMDEALEGLRSELKEKAAELTAIQNSKIDFGGSKKSVVSQQEIDTAVLTAKVLGRDIDGTDYFKGLMTKASTGDHLSQMTEDWEQLFSTNMYQDIQDKTVIEPLFTNRIKMNSRTMTFPWNPEAGYAGWIAEGDYAGNSAFIAAPTDDKSTGAAVSHKPNDNTLTAEKLATKEYLGYEEEEDSIIPLMPIIRDALVRRMVRSTDQELVLGDVTVTLNSGVGKIDGFSTIATDATGFTSTQPGAFGDPTTIADLQGTRRLMGVYGLMPGELMYIVSQAVMYDLMEDPDFRTTDLVGDRATILRGQIGSVNGSPVIVSDAFEADAATKVQAVALNVSNYLFGELRGLTVERDKNIEQQKNILVATRRFGFTEIVPATNNVRSSCAVLKRPA